MTFHVRMKGKAKIPVGTMEDFHRPKHNDFATTSELKVAKFSGIRHNQLAAQMEIWTLGDIRATVPEHDEDALAKAMQDVFGIDVIKIMK